MSLRKMLGADAERVHEQVDALLDREDAMIVLVDSARAINYANGFGISPSQLEWLALDIERAVRNVAGPAVKNSMDTRSSPAMDADRNASRKGRAVRRHPGRVQHGRHHETEEVRESGRHEALTESERSSRAVRVRRLAGEAECRRPSWGNDGLDHGGQLTRGLISG